MENPAKTEVAQDLRQSPEYGRYMEKIGWKTVHPGGVQMFVRKLGPVAIAKIQRVRLPLAWTEVEKVLKAERVFMCKLEPVEPGEIPQGFRRDGWPLLGTKTLRVDLRPGEEKILGGFKKDARYCIRQAQGHKGQITINNFDGFYEIWRQSARRKNLWIPGRKEYTSLVESFGKKCFAVTSGKDAGAVVLMHQGTAFYYYAGGTEEGNKQNLPYLAVWEAMREAKKRGCRVWDFEGILDPRWPNSRWRGFSHFKKSFGGVEAEYPGSFTKWRWPL